MNTEIKKEVIEMKNLLIGILICVIVVGVFGFLGGVESTYSRKATVTEVEGGIVTVVDDSGLLWYYLDEGIDEVGDEVVLIMNDQHTNDVFDDEIQKVKRWDEKRGVCGSGLLFSFGARAVAAVGRRTSNLAL